MENLYFLLLSGCLFTALIIAGCHFLPRERWQVLAVVPGIKRANGQWQGHNLTFYGFILASASALGILWVLILLEAASMPLTGVMLIIAALVMICIPAASLMAKIVEKKQYTFTIGGAFFCGLVALPFVVALVNKILPLWGLPTINTAMAAAALGIGYILGEGMGRLACLSFGCCYGKPLAECGALTQKIFSPLSFSFTGSTKKAVYEGHLAGKKLFPVQGLTCVLYTGTALLSTWLFLEQSYALAFLLSLGVSQIWRVISEFFRADFRGFSQISAYQKMSLAALPYGCCMFFLSPSGEIPAPQISLGLQIFTDPVPMIAVQALWLIMFFHFGRSMVTGSQLSFRVIHEHI